jgi:hypothetical protein
MTKYRSKPTEIEAMQWVRGETTDDLVRWTGQIPDGTRAFRVQFDGTAMLWCEKSEAWVTIHGGDYVVAEPDGVGFYPISRLIFERKYEPIDG